MLLTCCWSFYCLSVVVDSFFDVWVDEAVATVIGAKVLFFPIDYDFPVGEVAAAVLVRAGCFDLDLDCLSFKIRVGCWLAPAEDSWVALVVLSLDIMRRFFV